MRTNRLYRFDCYQLDGEERVLRRDGQPVTLPPKDLETLLALVENAGRIVEKEELLNKVWPGVFVEEGNLARRIFNLRQVLGETENGRKFIETIPTRGYRFVGEVRTATEPGSTGQSLIPGAVSAEPPQGKRFLWIGLLTGAAAVLATVVLLSRYWPVTGSAPQRVMLAVLPFVNLSGDSHEDYFADGLTDEMTAQLGQLQPSRLGVIARTSTMRYKDTKETAAQIGRDLGVGYLLEGSVRRAGGRVRVTAQLIRAPEQTHLWAETYERPATDVLQIQREIAEKITHSLSIQLLPAGGAPAQPPFNLESHDRYLLGLHALGEGTRDSTAKAVRYFEEGIERNPKDARLYAALGEAFNASVTYYSSPADVMPRAKEAALQALQLDPNLASAHVTLGNVHLLFDWDWPAAEREYLRALELNPNSPEAQLGYANYLATLGRFDEALSRVQQAYLFDPLALESRNEALWIYYFSSRMPETIEQARKTVELEPQAGLPYAIMAMAYARLENHDETLAAADKAVRFADSPSILTAAASALARAGETSQAKQVLEKALAQARERYVCRFLVGAAYVELGDNRKAFESLQQAFLQRST